MGYLIFNGIISGCDAKNLQKMAVFHFRFEQLSLNIIQNKERDFLNKLLADWFIDVLLLLTNRSHHTQNSN